MRQGLVTAMILTLLSGCGTTREPLRTVEQVDLERFMGDWYVIANIPTFHERGAHNAVESYRLNPDGSIATTFTFRSGSFDGELKTYRPTGFVRDASNAVWGMQFIWPVKADYRIIYLTPDYAQTVIARERRDYLWIMARTPAIPDADYQRILELVREAGYDPQRVQRVPQCWSDCDKARR